MTDLYYIRPGRPECLKWTQPEGSTKAVRVLLEELVGLTKVDADVFETHLRVYCRENE